MAGRVRILGSWLDMLSDTHPLNSRSAARWLVRFVVLSTIGLASWSWGGAAWGQEKDVGDLDSGTASRVEGGEDSGDPSDAGGKTTEKSNLLSTMFKGNPFGVVVVVLILLLSALATYFIVEHAITITRGKLLPEHVLTSLEQHISRGEIFQAIELCRLRENYSLATEVILAGLERYQGSEFGFAEYRAAVEEAGADQTGRLYRKTEVLHLIGSISPMLGLTGTVIGMIEAFNTIAAREGMARPEELAGGIGQALITTLLGLVVAIPAMVAFSYYRNRIDGLVAEAGKRVERLMMPLGRKRKTK